MKKTNICLITGFFFLSQSLYAHGLNLGGSSAVLPQLLYYGLFFIMGLWLAFFKEKPKLKIKILGTICLLALFIILNLLEILHLHDSFNFINIGLKPFLYGLIGFLIVEIITKSKGQ